MRLPPSGDSIDAAGVEGTDDSGPSLDRREFKETQAGLRFVATADREARSGAADPDGLVGD